MKRPFKSFVSVSEYEPSHGWAVYRIVVDCVISYYFCSTHLFIEGNMTYDFDLFVDYAAELPLYFFQTHKECIDFTLRHSNMYPIDRQFYLLRFRPQFWFATLIQKYLEVIQWENEITEKLRCGHLVE